MSRHGAGSVCKFVCVCGRARRVVMVVGRGWAYCGGGVGEGERSRPLVAHVCIFAYVYAYVCV